MQKIILKNNMEINNIQGIFGYTETLGENDKREVLSIKFLNNSVDNLYDLLFTDTSVLDTIKIADSETGDLQGIHERYNIACNITNDFIGNVIEVKIARKSSYEQQILDMQLALAELGSILSEVK